MEQATPAALPSAAAPAAPWRPYTWQLLALVVALTLVVLWFYQHKVLTREAYQAILGDRLETWRIDDLLASRQRAAIWGYVLTPVVVAARVAFVACFVQLLLLFILVEVPLGRLFRAATLAYLALLYGQAMRVVLLARMDTADLSERVLGRMPASVSALFLDPARHGEALYALGSMLNGFELLWCVVMAWALASTLRLCPAVAAGVTLAAWCLMTALQWGLAVYLLGRSG
jgi:hypothetical protein